LRKEIIRKILHKKGIQTSFHYPAVHRFSIYNDIQAELPKTEYVADNEITLPFYFALEKEQVRYIISTVKDIIT